ncbi:hypothetical protein GOV13_04775 [Candidatus Pacearchaeota archaeon]|nr:hypothetical protein [Candidatus Pacearchaeota archaeon]
MTDENQDSGDIQELQEKYATREERQKEVDGDLAQIVIGSAGFVISAGFLVAGYSECDIGPFTGGFSGMLVSGLLTCDGILGVRKYARDF